LTSRFKNSKKLAPGVRGLTEQVKAMGETQARLQAETAIS